MVIQGVTYLSDFEAKKAIMEMARRLEAKGWLVAGDGSMSVRVGPQAVWVTIAGADKAALTQDMLVRVDMNGKAMLSAKPKPLPEDLPIHLKIYQENENAQCVMHTYPACAAVMGMQGQTVQPAAFSPAVRALGRVQLLPAQNVDAQAQAVSLLCRTDKAVLLENDGCLTWGKTPADAAPLVEALDYYAAVTAKLDCAGCSKCGSCSGHCSGCSKCGAPAVQPMAQPAAQPAPVPMPAALPAEPVSLPGVTGLIQPGMTLPVLPGKQAAPAPAPAPMPTAQPAAESAAVPAAAKPANARDAAMAEVIRRTLKSFQ